MMKITTKTWLAKIAAIFTHRTSLLHRINPPASFYSKTKIGYIFSFHFVFWCFDFHFRHACLNDLPVLRYKEQREQRKMYYWRRKIKQMLYEKSYHIFCSFKRNSSGISLSQLSVSSFLEKIHSAKEKF